MSKPIYKITCFFGVSNNNVFGRSYDAGFYYDKETAQKAILENWDDIFELGYYSHAILEEMPEGIGHTPSSRLFYEAKPIRNGMRIREIKSDELPKFMEHWNIV